MDFESTNSIKFYNDIDKLLNRVGKYIYQNYSSMYFDDNLTARDHPQQVVAFLAILEAGLKYGTTSFYNFLSDEVIDSFIDVINLYKKSYIEAFNFSYEQDHYNNLIYNYISNLKGFKSFKFARFDLTIKQHENYRKILNQVISELCNENYPGGRDYVRQLADRGRAILKYSNGDEYEASTYQKLVNSCYNLKYSEKNLEYNFSQNEMDLLYRISKKVINSFSQLISYPQKDHAWADYYLKSQFLLRSNLKNSEKKILSQMLDTIKYLWEVRAENLKYLPKKNYLDKRKIIPKYLTPEEIFNYIFNCLIKVSTRHQLANKQLNYTEKNLKPLIDHILGDIDDNIAQDIAKILYQLDPNYLAQNLSRILNQIHYELAPKKHFLSFLFGFRKPNIPKIANQLLKQHS